MADANSTLPIYATDQLFLAKEYKDLVVVYRNGAPVRLSDLGRVIDANVNHKTLSSNTAFRNCLPSIPTQRRSLHSQTLRWMVQLRMTFGALSS